MFNLCVIAHDVSGIKKNIALDDVRTHTGSRSITISDPFAQLTYAAFTIRRRFAESRNASLHLTTAVKNSLVRELWRRRAGRMAIVSKYSI